MFMYVDIGRVIPRTNSENILEAFSYERLLDSLAKAVQLSGGETLLSRIDRVMLELTVCRNSLVCYFNNEKTLLDKSDQRLLDMSNFSCYSEWNKACINFVKRKEQFLENRDKAMFEYSSYAEELIGKAVSGELFTQ